MTEIRRSETVQSVQRQATVTTEQIAQMHQLAEDRAPDRRSRSNKSAFTHFLTRFDVFGQSIDMNFMGRSTY